MPSIGIALYSSAAGLARPTTLISTAVVAAMEYAGALPATAMTTESNPLSAPWRRPRSLLDIHISWGRGCALTARADGAGQDGEAGPTPLRGIGARLAVRCATAARTV